MADVAAKKREDGDARRLGAKAEKRKAYEEAGSA